MYSMILRAGGDMMSEFNEKVYISAIKQAIGDEKLTHFAARAGISAGNLSRIRKGQIATPEILRKIADTSDTISFKDLMDAAGFTEKAFSDYRNDIFSVGIARVPVIYELDRSKDELWDDDTLEYEEYLDHTLPKGSLICFVAKDDAIVPVGSRVMIDTEKNPRDNDVVLFLLDDEVTLLRRVKKLDELYFYYGNDQNKYPMTPMKESQMIVYGVAVEAKISF